MRKTLLFITGMLCIAGPLFAQQYQTIKGMVRSAQTGEPIEGVTLILKRSRTNAISGEGGHFKITPSVYPDTLVASAIGFRTRYFPVRRNNSKPLLIQLAPAKTHLKEVVVSTGYQKIPKERATGSFDFINKETLNQQVGTNILDRLKGVASGVLFDSKRVSDIGNKQSPISVRGLSTINGPEGPLIIVDNFPYKGNLSNINPNDVENITILKDAAASSIWGTKAGNGVIVITTKSGRFNQPLKIEVNSTISFRKKPDLFSVRQMLSSDFIDVERFLFSKGYRFSDTSSSNRPPFSPVYEILFKERNGTITGKQAEQQIEALKTHDVRNDFIKYIYQTEVNQQYSITGQGGSTNDAYSFSAGYDKNVNNLDADYSRITLKLKNSFKPFRRFRVDMGIAFNQSESIGGKPRYSNVRTFIGKIPPYTRLADSKGDPLPVAKDYRQSYIDTLGGGRLLNWDYYPLEDYKHVSDVSKMRHLLLNFRLNYKIMKGLNVDVKYRYENQRTDGRLLNDRQSYFARNMINLYSELEPGGGITRNIPLGGILDLSQSMIKFNAIRGQLNLDRSWSKHSITAIAGAEVTQSHEISNSSRIYGYDNNTLTFSKVNNATFYPILIGYGNFIPDGLSLSDKLNRFISVFGNAAYTYDRKYTVSISGRRDGSNLFGVSTNNKWNPLWSAGISWDISKEQFYNSAAIPYLKLRATYGFSGNVDQSMAAVTTIQYIGSNPYTNNLYSVVDNFSNPDLKWEKVRTINAGIDFNAFSGRLSGSVDLYQKIASDLLGKVFVDYTVGLGQRSITRNVGKLETRGVDVMLNSLNIDRGIRWHTSLLINLNKDKITHYNFVPKGSILGSGKAVMTGKPVWGVYSLKWAGLDPQTGAPRGYLNGQISEDYSSIIYDTPNSDLIFHGKKVPTLYGSLHNSLSWKGFTLNILIAYRLGYYFRRPSINYSSLFGNGSGDPDFAKRWKNSGDESTTNVPSMVYPVSSLRDVFYNNSEILVDKADNIRLQYINVGYEMNRSRFKGLPVDRVELYLNASNLGIIWKANKDGIDPDNQGIRPSHTFSIGLRASF